MRYIRFALMVILTGLATPVMQAAQVHLAWNAPLSADAQPFDGIAGYLVCLGTQPDQYTTVVDNGPERSVILRDLDPHTTYYVAVKAYDAQGTMSEASEALAWVFDANANGLPDAWEASFFGTEASGGFDADFSGNGVSNGEAYIAGTDPTDPADMPTLDARRGPDGSVQLLIPSRQADGPGYLGQHRLYAIEYTDNPQSGHWHPLPGFAAIDATDRTVAIPVVAESALRCYRLRIRLTTD